jgi:general secretion pathway protein M
MIGELRAWYVSRSRREQLMLLLMLAVALPVLAWLLVVRPLSAAYDRALVDHLEGVDRHGRVLALTGASSQPVRGRQSGGDLQLLVTQTAAQAGIALERIVPAGPNTVEVSGIGVRAPSATQWLQQLETRGLRAEQLTMTPLPDGSINLSARLAR